MDLNRKVFWIIVITMAGSLAAMGVVADQVILESFRRLERNEVQEDLQRVIEAVEQDLEDLDFAVRDWAQWNDTYAFVQDGDGAFVDSNIVAASFTNNRIEYMVFFDADGEVAAAYRHVEGEVRPASEGFIDALRNHSLDRSPGGLAQLGFLVSGGSWKVAARPILQTGGEGPAMGVLVWARPFEQEAMAELEAQTHLDLELRVIAASDQSGIELQQTGESPLVSRIQDTLEASTVLHDLGGTPVLSITVRVPRTTYQEGLRSVAYFVGAMVVAGGALMVSMTALLDRTVLSRLNRLSHQVDAIRQNPAVVGRVAVPGQDEIGRLALQFNRLLESSEQHLVAIERSNQDLEGFARVVSHDLQPHLSTILLNAAILRQGQAASLGAAEAARLDRIENTAKRMGELMRGILDYSTAASVRGAWGDVDLQALMEEVVSTLEDSIAKTDARVEWRGLPTVSGNRIQLQQLLQNLIGNALKYHREGVPPHVTITAGPALDVPKGHRVEIRDNGQGFDPAQFHDMVQPFFRLREDSSGHGLGLATCMKIAQRHGGILAADSVPGEGSVFAVELPAAGQTTAPSPVRDAL